MRCLEVKVTIYLAACVKGMSASPLLPRYRQIDFNCLSIAGCIAFLISVSIVWASFLLYPIQSHALGYDEIER